MRGFKYSEEKVHIQAIFQRKSKINENSQTLAHCLNKDIHTELDGLFKLIFEQIQNADDAEANDLSFTLEGEYLIISHNGHHFSYHDVEKICNYAPQDDAIKINDLNKTGHKGIGFKSIFSVSECVVIVSANYQFRFDKRSIYQHFESVIHSGEQTEFPWQISPVWTEDKDLPVFTQPFDKSRVYFVVKIRTGVEIVSGLKELLDSSHFLLFLKHIKKITVNGQSIEKTMGSKSVITIERNNNMESSWLVESFNINIPSTMIAYLNQLNDYACPQKLKTAHQITMKFAARIQSGRLVEHQNSYLACGLPTQEQLGLPFLVDALFLLNAERTRLLHDNTWNEFLLAKCAQLQFTWMRQLAETPEWHDSMLAVLGPPELITSNKKVKQFYEAAYKKSLLEIRCFPTCDNTFSLFNQLRCDVIGFFRKLSQIVDHWEPHILDDTLLYREKLLAIGMKKFDRMDLIRDIQIYAERIPTKDFLRQKIFLELIYQVFTHKSPNNPRFQEALRHKFFIVDQTGRLNAPSHLFITTSETTDCISFIDVRFPHPEIVQHNDGDLKAWLIQVGAHEGNRRAILDYIYEHTFQITQDNVLLLGRFIYDSYCCGELRETHSFSDYKKLANFPFLTQQGELQLPGDCLLSNAYHPKMDLEVLFVSHHLMKNTNVSSVFFVSPDYIRPEDDKVAWHDLFLKLGVIDHLDLLQKDRVNSFVDNPRLDYAKGYMEKLSAKAPGGGRPVVLNFIGVYYLAHLNCCPNYSQLFWQMFIAHWPIIKANVNVDHAHYSSNRYNSCYAVIPYLQYVLQQHVDILKAQDLYWDGIQDFLTPQDPIANLPVTLSCEQAEFIGLRTKVSLTQALQLLTQLAKKGSQTISQFVMIVKHILRYYCEGDLNKREIVRWSNSGGVLIAADNTYQPVDKLSFLPGEELPFHDRWLKKTPYFTEQEIKIICELFCIDVVTDEILTTDFGYKKIFDEMKDSLFLWIPLFTMEDCVRKNISIKKAWPKIRDAWERLVIFQVEKISLSRVSNTDYRRSVNYYYAGHEIYFSGDLNYRQRKSLYAYLASYLEFSESACQSMVNIMSHYGSAAFSEEVDELLEKLGKTREDYQRMVSELQEMPAYIFEKTPVLHCAPHVYVNDDLQIDRTQQNNPEKKTKNSIEIHPDQVSLMQFAPRSSIRPAQVSKKVCSVKQEKKQAEDFECEPSKIKETTNLSTFNNMSLFSSVEEVDEPLSNSDEVGYFGEKIVYEKLKAELIEAYGYVAVKETELGVEIKKDKDILALHWFNKPYTKALGEGPTDIALLLNGNIIFYIEVKATQSMSDHRFFITPNEWTLMREKTNQYVLARVYGVYQENPSLLLLKNPFKMIMEGYITLAKMGAFRLCIPEHADLSSHQLNDFSTFTCAMSFS